MNRFEREGMTMKLTKWLAQCNGSAVVSPLPNDRNISGSASPGNISNRSADKILELLGPENRDQQRQIHDLLKKSGEKCDEDDDSDSSLEDESFSTTSRSFTPPSYIKTNGFDAGFSRVVRGVVIHHTSPFSSSRQPSPLNSPLNRYHQHSSPVPVPRTEAGRLYRHTPGSSPPRLSGSGYPVYDEPARRSLTQLYFSPRHSRSPSPHRFLGASPMATFVRGDLLGSGSYGAVYKGKDLRTGMEVALKVLHDDEALCPQEVAVLCRLNHTNIVQYLGTTTDTDGRSCIILELMSCSLASLLRDREGLEESRMRSYTRQVLLGLEYLHAKQIVHRDIKCANILLDRRGTAKLSDFGVSKKIGHSMAKSCKGTFAYMAPEVLLSGNCGNYGVPADIWSLGCMVIEMATSKPPWSSYSMIEIMIKIKEGNCPPIPKGLSSEAASFVRSCFRKDPKQRPTASLLLRHSFLNCT